MINKNDSVYAIKFYSMQKQIDKRDKEINRLQNLIDKTTNYYLKTLDKNKSMPDDAVEMFNLLEENK